MDQAGKGNALLDENPLCFTFGAGNYDRMAIMDCATPLDGRYMTFQKRMTQLLELDDVLVCEYQGTMVGITKALVWNGCLSCR